MIRLLKYLWICLITENEIVSSGLTDNEREADEVARNIRAIAQAEVNKKNLEEKNQDNAERTPKHKESLS